MPTKKLTRKDIQPGVVYVLLEDQPDGSTFMKGDRVKLSTARDARPLEFVREDGRTVAIPFVTSKYLALADQKGATMPAPKPLTVADIRHGVTYVTLRDNPSCSGFLKGERIRLQNGSRPGDCLFERVDGSPVQGPYVNPLFLTIAAEKEVPVTKTLTNDDIRFGQVYVVLCDRPNSSSFKKGDRIKLRDANSNKKGPFVYENGDQVLGPYVDAQYLAFADGKPAKLGEADLRHGQVYVVLTDKASGSDFKKGDRVKLRAGSRPFVHNFVYEDGREVSCPYVSPEYLAFADGGKVSGEVVMFKKATPEDLKPGAVFKVEGVTDWHSIPPGSLVKHTGAFSHGTNFPQMQLLVTEGTGKRQYIRLEDMVLVIPGSGDVARPKPKSGSGKTIKSASRSDGFMFLLKDCGEDGYLMEAGCRWFTMAEAEKHWTETRLGTDLGNETFDILRLFNGHIVRLEAAKKKGA